MNDKKPDVSHYDKRLAHMYSTTDNKQQQYDQWAGEYEQDLVEDLGYVAPQDACDVFARVVTDRSARVLDVACGTGLAGDYLKAHGFFEVDGSDFSEEMLKISAQRGVYQNVWQHDFTAPVEDSGCYDALVCVGMFSYAVPKISDMHHVVNCVKPGGRCVITVNGGAWKDLNLEPKVYEEAASHGFTVDEVVTAGYIEKENIDSKILVITRDPE